MVGFPTAKLDIDARAGQLALTLRDVLDDIQRMKVFLDGKPDADLAALGYTTDEVATLKSAFADLAKLARVATGQDTQAAASDFFFFARRLTGVA